MGLNGLKFTEGDWTLEKQNYYHIKCNERTLADINPHIPESEGNARIMAAAPQLYIALRKLLESSREGFDVFVVAVNDAEEVLFELETKK